MEAESIETESIAEALRGCVASWAAVIQVPPTNIDRSQLMLQLNRLQLWAGNIGVFATGGGSIDHRLQNDTDTKDVVLGMIRRLSQKAKDLGNFTQGSMLASQTVEYQSNDEPNSSEDLSNSGSDSPEKSESDFLMQDEKNSPAEKWLQNVKQLVDRLFLVASVVRKPLKYQNSDRIFKSIDLHGPQAEELLDLAGHVRFQLRRAMFIPQEEAHEVPSETLISRLADAAVFRRQRLMYKQRHQKKLQKGTDFAFQQALPNLVLRVVDPEIRSQDEQVYKSAQPKSGKHLTQSVSTSTVLSDTIASSVFPIEAKQNFHKPAMSMVSRSVIVRQSKLDFPPVPKFKGDEDIICPYCYVPQDFSLMQEVRWRRHIMQDLEPYICVFEPCNSGNKIYSSIDDCMQHMMWNHGVVWTCSAPGHEDAVFDRVSDLEEHLTNEHPSSVTPSQVKLILDKSTRPREDIFSVCPLCLDPLAAELRSRPSEIASSNIADDPVKTFRTHIAQHLEQIALLSLPPRVDLDVEEESQVKQNEHLSLSSLGTSEVVFPDLEELSSDVGIGSYIGSKDEAVPDVPDPPEGVSTGSPGDGIFKMPLWQWEKNDYNPYDDPVLRPFVERAEQRSSGIVRQQLQDLLVMQEISQPFNPTDSVARDNDNDDTSEQAKAMAEIKNIDEEQIEPQTAKPRLDSSTGYDINAEYKTSTARLIPDLHDYKSSTPNAPTTPYAPDNLWPAVSSARFRGIVREFHSVQAHVMDLLQGRNQPIAKDKRRLPSLLIPDDDYRHKSWDEILSSSHEM